MRRIFTCLCLLCLLMIPSRAAHADQSMTTDLLIVGGSESAVAAAITAARLGVRSITMVSDTDWLGGQFTSEALMAIDENRGARGYDQTVPMPRHGMFKETIDRIEALNAKKYGVPRPGNTRVITTTRPADAAKVFEDMVRPYVESGQLRIIRRMVPTQAILSADGNTLGGVRFASPDDDHNTLQIKANLTVDASDWGDVIQLAGAGYEFGPDLKDAYGEPEAPVTRDQAPITDMNPITYNMVIVETDEYKPIDQPAGYQPDSYRKHTYPKDPARLYQVRRLIDHYHFADIDHPDVILLCFPAFDYPLDALPQAVVDALEADEPGASKKNIVQMTRRQRQIVFDNAKQFSLGYLHYLQTEAHEKMKDKTHSFRRFVLTDEFGTPDRMPPKPYVREGLRLKAMYMSRQQDTLGAGGPNHFANVMYHDTVAVWQFEYDFHPTRREFLNEGDAAGPWRAVFRKLRDWKPPDSGRATFGVRSVIPRKVDGLLGGGHNLGYTSIVSSGFRLHDQMMAAGQAIGAVAATAIEHGVQPRAIPYDALLMESVWNGLMSRAGGAEPAMLWPFADVDPSDDCYVAVNQLAVRGMLPLGPGDVHFEADKPATPDWRGAVVERSMAVKQVDSPIDPPTGDMTRGQFAERWWGMIRDLPPKTFERVQPDDADGDGTLDGDDPLPFRAGVDSWSSP